MKVDITTISHKNHRYPTVGDWRWHAKGKDEFLTIEVSDTGNEDYNFLLSVHELLEAYLCKRDGIKEEDVTNFDIHFEEMRTAFPDLVGDMEPGDHDNAPYQKQHKIASMMEKWLADNMKIDWEAYNKTVNEL